jgi:hypothetical protein
VRRAAKPPRKISRSTSPPSSIGPSTASTKANGLGQIFISATTIKSAADKILDESLITQLVTLGDHLAAVRTGGWAATAALGQCRTIIETLRAERLY